MINAINFLGQVNPQQNLHSKNKVAKPMEYDCFVQNKTEAAIKSARQKIIHELIKNGIEYSFVISPEGKVCHTNSGNRKKCSVDSRKIVPGAIMLHGHPEPLPLSSGDIAVLLTTDAQSEEALTKEGKFSRLTKQHLFRSPKTYEEMYYELEKQLNLMALEKLGIDYNENSDDVLQMGRDFVKDTLGQDIETVSDSDVFQYLTKFGIDTNQSPKDIMEALKKLMYYQLLFNPNKYNKAHNCIIDNKDEIYNFLETQEGIKTRHELVQRIADKYGMLYETNL